MSDLVTQADNVPTRKVTFSAFGAVAGTLVSAIVNAAMHKYLPDFATAEVLTPLDAVITGLVSGFSGWVVRERARLKI